MNEFHTLIPPISALRALVSLSKTGSITKTAAAIGLTQSAVSHQMKTLESALDFAVLAREGRSVQLTPRARQYVSDIAPALKTLAQAGDTTQLSGHLNLNIAPGFAASWLAPRIGYFIASHPGLSISVNTPRGYGDLGRRDDDIYVSFLPSELAPPHARHLMDVGFFPVAAPKLTAGSSLHSINDLLAYPLLHLDGPQDWTSWAADAGHKDPIPRGGIVFQDMQIMAAAARSGQGVALGDALTSADALSRGDLVRLHPHEWPSPRAYWLIAGETADTDGRRAFTDWVLNELGV